MEYKKIRLIIFALIAFTILSKGLTITISKNCCNLKPEAHMATDSTIYVLQLSSQLEKTYDGE